MHPNQPRSVAVAALAAILLWWDAAPLAAQSALRYAGDLGPTFGEVSDLCEFEFALYDATADGTQVGDTIHQTLQVRGGLYETDLDFGPDAFDSSSRYLEAAVGCPAGKASLTTLTRRAFPGPIRTRTGADAADGAEQPGRSAKAALGTGFTYQGELRSSGSPVTGSGDFQFSLWDAATGGAQIGATLKTYGIAVDGGRFTTTLDFGAAAFDGQARWLEIAVDFPSGTGTFTTLSPRQLISASPYALQTRGLYVTDAGDVGVGTLSPQARLEVADDGSRAMRVRSTAATGGVALQASAGSGSGWATAIEASTGSPDGAGLYAFNEAESGTGYALYGETTSPDGIAVFGHAANDDQFSSAVGVHGRTDSDDLAAGVLGESTATAGFSYGVLGVARAGEGVRGENATSGNRGSLGTGSAGVEGHATDPTDFAGSFTGGKSYFAGPVGIATTTPSADLHVAGDARVDGDLRLNAAEGLSFGDPNTRIYENLDDLIIRTERHLYLQPDDDLFVDLDTLVVDSSANRVGIGQVTPEAELDVTGDIRASGDFRYSSERTHELQIPIAAFQRTDLDESAKFNIGHRYGFFSGGPPPYITALVAPVQLPQGAEVQEFSVLYKDSDVFSNLTVSAELIRGSVTAIGGAIMAVVEAATSGDSGAIQSTSTSDIDYPTVDNHSYTYVIRLDFQSEVANSTLGVYGCRIRYTVTAVQP